MIAGQTLLHGVARNYQETSVDFAKPLANVSVSSPKVRLAG